MLLKCQAFFNQHFLINREGTIFATDRCKISSSFKKGEARCPDYRGGKIATTCGKIGKPGTAMKRSDQRIVEIKRSGDGDQTIGALLKHAT
jgi:hypothetical protein